MIVIITSLSRSCFSRSSLLLAALCLAISLEPASTASSRLTTKQLAAWPLKKMYSPIASTIAFTNRSTTALKRHSSHIWSRIDGNRKKLASKASAAGSKLFSLSDPLHAYPNSLDKAVHALFRRVSVWEVNNADLVRSAINTARSFSIFSVLATAVGMLLSAVIPGGLVLTKRSDDEDVEYEEPDRWRQVNEMAQFVLNALESGQLKYSV